MRFMAQLQPSDLVAIILIIGYIALSFHGNHSDLASSILVIVGFYFGREHFMPSKPKE